MAQQPDDPFLHHALGQLQAAQARWPEARRAFAAARRVDPANPVYALNLAISLDRMGQREEALNYYRATLKTGGAKRLRPGYPSGRQAH